MCRSGLGRVEESETWAGKGGGAAGGNSLSLPLGECKPVCYLR